MKQKYGIVLKGYAKEHGGMFWGVANVLYLDVDSSNMHGYLLKLSQLYTKDL